MYSFKPENILDKFSEYIHYYLVVHLLFTYCKIAPKPLDGLNHRVGIGQKSPYRESYTVNHSQARFGVRVVRQHLTEFQKN